MSTANLRHSPLRPDRRTVAGFVTASLSVSTLLGASELSVNVVEIPPGNHLCPYHYEYVEEWLAVLVGPVVVRTPDGHESLGDGDVLCFPSGPAGAHRVSCPPDACGSARVLMFSRNADPEICVYPDSDKLGVFFQDGVDEVFVRRAETSSHLDYYDGETP